MFKIKNKFHRSSFFYSIFVPFVLVGGLLIISFGVYTYRKTYNNIQSSLITDRKSYVNQVKGNLDQRIQTVEFSFTTYSNTNSFRESIDKPLDYRNYKEVKEISSELAYIGVMGINNATYRLVSLFQGWEVSNGSLYQLPDETVDQLYQEVMDAQRYLTWKPTEKGIKMMLLLPTFETERSAIGIANINNRAIKELIDDNNEQFFTIFDDQNNLMYQNTKSPVDKNIQEKLGSLTDKEGYFRDDKGDTYIYTKSDYNQWVYLSRLPKQKVRSAVRNLEISLVVIMFLLLVAFVLVSYLVASSASKPMRKIRAVLSVNEPANGREAEINQILTGIDTIIEENTDLSVQLKQQKPELENLFQLNLFRGRLTKKESEEKLEQLGYQIAKNERFAVVLIQIDDLGDRDPANQDIFLLAIENLVSEIIPSKRRFSPIILNQYTQATILRLTPAMGHKQIIDYCGKIRQAAKKYLKLKISFGISDFYHDLSQSKLAIDNGKEALHFRLNLGEESLIFFDEIVSQLDEKSIIKYPVEAEQRLLDAMRSDRKEIIQQNFEEVFDFIIQENHNPITIENALLRLINSIIQLGQLLGADYEILQNSRKIYGEVLSKDNLREIQKLLLQELILPIVGTIQHATDREMKNLSDKMVVLVHKQYDEDISLESVADELHYNSNYLSGVFKKEMGINFVDYLQNYRLMKAKEWLVDTKMTIKEISERLQYTNSQNFIRFFKKKENMTPGEYRKQHKNMGSSKKE